MVRIVTIRIDEMTPLTNRFGCSLARASAKSPVTLMREHQEIDAKIQDGPAGWALLTPLLLQAVALNEGGALLEASGGYDEASIFAVAKTGANYISVGALAKHCRAVDLSMCFTQT